MFLDSRLRGSDDSFCITLLAFAVFLRAALRLLHRLTYLLLHPTQDEDQVLH